MLPKKIRLSVREFYKKPLAIEKEKDKFFLYKKKVEKSEHGPKIAITVSKKLSKLSVNRNRAKRLIKETVIKVSPRLKPGALLLITPHTIITKEKPRDLLPIMKKTLEKLKAI